MTVCDWNPQLSPTHSLSATLCHAPPTTNQPPAPAASLDQLGECSLVSVVGELLLEEVGEIQRPHLQSLNQSVPNLCQRIKGCQAILSHQSFSLLGVLVSIWLCLENAPSGLYVTMNHNWSANLLFNLHSAQRPSITTCEM